MQSIEGRIAKQDARNRKRAERRAKWHHRRMMWWQWRTIAVLSLPWVRRRWHGVFHTEPMLHNARHYADNPDLGHSQMAYETMAGAYNDSTRGGFMTYQQARAIYEEGRKNVA